MANNILAGLAVKLQVAFATTDPFAASPSYTDITTYVSRAAGDFDPATYGGSAIAGVAEPGSLLIPLKNQDGRFDPKNTSAPAPMLGNLVIDRRVVWMVGGVSRFHGYVESWTPGDDIDGKAICWLKATCPLGILARYQLQGIGLADWVLNIAATPPTAYFRTGDKDGIELFDEVSQRSRGQYHDRRRRATGLALRDPDSAAGLAVSAGAFLGVSGDSAPAGAGAFGVSVLINVTSVPSGGTPDTIWEVGSLNLYIGATGVITLIGTGIAIAGPTITPGLPTVVTVRRQSNGTSYTIGLQDATRTPLQTVSGSGAAYTIAAGTPLYVGGGPNAGGPHLPGDADEIMIWQSVDPTDAVLAEISQREVWGFPNAETASERSLTSARQAGFPASQHVALDIDTQLDTPLDGSDLPSGDLLRDQQKIAATVGSDFFSRPDGKLYHRGYRLPALDPTPDLVFDDAVGTANLRYSTFEGSVASTDRRTSVTASDGVSVGEARSEGDESATDRLSISIYQRWGALEGDQHVGIAAKRRLRQVAPSESRIKFSVDLGRLTSGQRTSVLTVLQRGALVQLTHRPPDGSVRTYLAEVIKTSDRCITAGTYRIDVETQPYPEAYPTAFRRSQLVDVTVATGVNLTPFNNCPRWDTDGHGTSGFSPGTDAGLISGPDPSDPSVYLIGASAYWDANAAGYRALHLSEGGVSSTHWAAETEPGSATSGNIQGVVSLVRQADVPELCLTARQTSGGSLIFRGSGFPTTNQAFAPDLWGVRVPTDNHAVRVCHSVDQSTVSAVGLTVAYDSERFDDDGLHSTVTNNNRISPVRTGLYVVGVNGAFAVNGSGGREFSLNMGGNDRARFGTQPPGTEYGCGWAISLERVTSLAGSPFFSSKAAQSCGAGLGLLSVHAFSPEFWAIECDGPGARMRKTGSVSVASSSGTWTQLGGYTTDFDTDSIISGDSLVLTEDGPWLIYGTAEFTGNTNGVRGLQISTGHVIYGRSLVRANGGTQCIQVATLVDGRAGDAYVMAVTQDSGSTLTVQGAADYACVFAAVKVSGGG